MRALDWTTKKSWESFRGWTSRDCWNGRKTSSLCSAILLTSKLSNEGLCQNNFTLYRKYVKIMCEKLLVWKFYSIIKILKNQYSMKHSDIHNPCGSLTFFAKKSRFARPSSLKLHSSYLNWKGKVFFIIIILYASYLSSTSSSWLELNLGLMIRAIPSESADTIRGTPVLPNAVLMA